MFPTIMNIAQSPNGKSMTPLLTNQVFRSVNEWFAGCLSSWCPSAVLKAVVQCFAPGLNNHDTDIVIKHLLDQNVCRQAMHMGCTEMQELKENNPEFIDSLMGEE